MFSLRHISLLVALAYLAAGAAEAQQQKVIPKRPRPVAEPAPADLAGKAEVALEKQDYATAERLLKQATQEDPNSYAAWYMLGFVYSSTERRDLAIEAYRKSVSLNPKLFESNLNLGLALAAASQPVEAEKYLRAATALKPSDPKSDGPFRAWFALGTVLSRPKPAEAAAALQQAAALQPNSAEVQLALGESLEAAGDLSGAEAAYSKAVEIQPTTDAFAALSNLYMRGKRLPQAEAALRRFLETDPANVTARLQLARTLAAQNKNAEAVTELETALKASPQDAEIAQELASQYVAAGKFLEAMPLLETAVQGNPKDARLRHVYGQALLRAQRFPQAEQQLLAALQLNPQLGEAYGDLALAASRNEKFELAIRALDARAKSGQPETPGTLFLRATAYDSLKLFPQAIDNYQQFLAAAGGKFPEQEWKARHRLIAIDGKKK